MAGCGSAIGPARAGFSHATGGNVMGATMFGKALLVWGVILLLAIANGGLRERLLVPWLGLNAGLVLSGLLLAALILGVAVVAVPWLGSRNPRELGWVGIGWLLATLVFEFGFGLLRGKPLGEILAAYTFRDGNLWPLVVLVTAAAPWLAGRIRGWF